MCLRESEILPRRCIPFQAHPVGLICRQRLELDESPCNVVGALVRQEVADQMAAAAGNDRPPVLRVRFERSTLKRIDVVTDEQTMLMAGMIARCIRSMIRLTSNHERRSEH